MRQALGRGIEALIPDAMEQSASAEAQTARVRRIPLAKVRPNRLQPRRRFDQEKLKELAQSIKETGLAQPIVVSYDISTDTYELVTGERRLRAAELAGLQEIEAIIKDPDSDQHRLRLALVENVQREDLNPMEEALGYLRLMREFAMTQNQLSQLLGKSKFAVSNTLRLLNLPQEIQDALHDEKITEGHARALLTIKNPLELLKLFRIAVKDNLSVRDVEEYARRLTSGTELPGKEKRRERAPKPADIRAAEESLQHRLGTKVDIRTARGGAKGVISIHFFSLDDYDRIVKIIGK